MDMKRILFLSLIVMVFMAGCNSEPDEKEDTPKDDVEQSEQDAGEETEPASGDEEQADEEKEPLSLQMTKVDEDAGYTIEENDLYSQLNQLIEENPTQGEANDFSLYVIDTIDHPEGVQLLLLGINRLDEPIEDISFEFTLGNDEGEFVWDQKPITLPNEEFGPFKVDHAMPIILPLNEEQVDIVSRVDESNQVFEIENFEYNPAK